MNRVLKWQVPVDDQEHQVGGGRVALVAIEGPIDYVTLWTIEPDSARTQRLVRVFGTGQPLDTGWNHLGSARTRTTPRLVWHLFEQGRRTI